MGGAYWATASATFSSDKGFAEMCSQDAGECDGHVVGGGATATDDTESERKMAENVCVRSMEHLEDLGRGAASYANCGIQGVPAVAAAGGWIGMGDLV